MKYQTKCVCVRLMIHSAGEWLCCETLPIHLAIVLQMYEWMEILYGERIDS